MCVREFHVCKNILLLENSKEFKTFLHIIYKKDVNFLLLAILFTIFACEFMRII